MYYKTNNAQAIKAFNDYFAKSKLLQDNAQTFAESFGGCAAVITQDISQVQFRGIRFSGIPNRDVWAYERTRSYYWPRVKPKNKQAKTEFDEVSAKWKTGIAELQTIDKQMYLEPLGLKFGDTIFSGIGIFSHDGHLWIETDIKKLLPHCVEVLGSEWHKAKEEFNGVKK